MFLISSYTNIKHDGNDDVKWSHEYEELYKVLSKKYNTKSNIFLISKYVR